MQNKGFVKVFAVLLTLVCLFYLSFSFVTKKQGEKVNQWATEQTASWISELQDSGVTVTDAEQSAYFDYKKEEYLETNKEKKVWLGI